MGLIRRGVLLTLVLAAAGLVLTGCDDDGGDDDDCTVPEGLYTGTMSFSAGSCPQEFRDLIDGTELDIPVGEGEPCGTFSATDSNQDGGCTFTSDISGTGTSDGFIGGSMTTTVECDDGFSCTDMYNMRF